MKSALLLDQDADLTSVPEKYRSKLNFVVRKGRTAPVAIYPKGTVFEGDHAVLLVKTGQATPIDAECREACGMSPEQVSANGIAYEMDSKGIHSEKDRQLYLGGVILGYDDKLEYIHGPNWDAYEAAKKELELADEV